MSALCIVSRQYLTFLPNIKPVTSIVIITAREKPLAISLELVTVVTMVSGALLGTGTWIPFQLLGWYVIALLGKLTTKLRPHLLWEWILILTSGYLYGLIVSLEKLLIGGPIMFLTYWTSGLLFDTLHTIGNVLFYPICKTIMHRVDNIGR